MIEDKLSKDERIRLEALAQATAHTAAYGNPDATIHVAEIFTRYIKGETSESESVN